MLGHHQQQNFSNSSATTLRRETTDEIASIYTTLYDEDLLRAHQQALLSSPPSSPWMNQPHQFQQQQFQFAQACSPLQSPASPCFSTYSSESSSSPQSSNASPSGASGSLFPAMDSEEADELAGLFNITIEDLLSGNNNNNWSSTARIDPIQARTLPREQLINPTLDFSLFGTVPSSAATPQQNSCHSLPQQNCAAPQHFEPQALQFDIPAGNMVVTQPHSHLRQNSTPQLLSQQQHQQQLPRSYLHQLQQHQQQQQQHYHALQSSFQQQQQQAQQQQQYFQSLPSSPVAQSPSTPSSPFPALSLPSTPAMGSIDSMTSNFDQTSTPHSPLFPTGVTTTLSSQPIPSLPGTEGMQVFRNEDGSIMVFNPQTENVTFRCEFCPAESYGRIHDLKRHQASKHQAQTWPCEFCQRPFARRDALLRHYTVKATREDGIHPASHEVEQLMAARARAKLI
ncbi:hypothetical protein BGZ83_004240 [Gryganskiella cystojenkinii]|nr:hypothetical protein BGZ83_004240 [Gryganskiella cystojenkinii]